MLVALATAGVAAVLGIISLVTEDGAFLGNPIAGARVQMITDFDGVEPAATVSHDGHFVAFLSNQDGPMDVWVTHSRFGTVS